MFQKEVAERIASGPGNRDYGILSVFMQMYYDVELLFVLDQKIFNLPRKLNPRYCALLSNRDLFRTVMKNYSGVL